MAQKAVGSNPITRPKKAKQDSRTGGLLFCYNLRMSVVGIAGGSGAGKSAVSYMLVDAEPEVFEVINLDDYQKRKTDDNLPKLHGKINWDHPDIMRWDDLLEDLKLLEQGHEVEIEVWSHRSNPDYALHGKMVPRTLQPKPIIIVEGYLALYDKVLNQRYARTYYLEADEPTRLARRKSARGGKSNIIGDETYEEQVLFPMHRRYVEPTKSYANKIIDVSSLSVEQLAEVMRDDIRRHIGF